MLIPVRDLQRISAPSFVMLPKWATIYNILSFKSQKIGILLIHFVNKVANLFMY